MGRAARSSGSACATPAPRSWRPCSEFGLPGPLVDALGAPAKRSTLKLVGETLFAVVTTATWVEAEEAVRLGEVQLVLGDAFVVSVDRGAAVLDGVRQDLQADPELVDIGPAAVLPCVVDHAVQGYGPVLIALHDAAEEVEEAVFSPERARPTERIYKLSLQALVLRRPSWAGPSATRWCWW